jgi:hypothetical protein
VVAVEIVDRLDAIVLTELNQFLESVLVVSVACFADFSLTFGKEVLYCLFGRDLWLHCCSLNPHPS